MNLDFGRGVTILTNAAIRNWRESDRTARCDQIYTIDKSDIEFCSGAQLLNSASQ